jgi:hypothetical protein
MVAPLRGAGEIMRRLRAACLLALLSAGCVSGPMLDNPMRVPGACADGKCDKPDDPTSIAVPPELYPALFDAALDAVDDYFPIAYSNRAEGRILGRPTTAPGFERPWMPGSPNFYERALVTLQAYRYRCEVQIRQAGKSGYFVDVVVHKELKDYPTTAGILNSVPIFGDAMSVDRDMFILVDPDVTTPIVTPGERWIPKGRERDIEQRILRKIHDAQ